MMHTTNPRDVAIARVNEYNAYVELYVKFRNPSALRHLENDSKIIDYLISEEKYPLRVNYRKTEECPYDFIESIVFREDYVYPVKYGSDNPYWSGSLE